MAAGNFYLPFVPVQTGNGFVVPGALVTFYAAGTTTKVTVYADEDRLVPLPNPVVADASGKLPAIYLADALYHVRITDADGALLNDIDQYAPGDYPRGKDSTVPGPANSTYASLALLKAAPQSNRSYTLAANSRQDVYTYVSGDFTGQADDYNVVKLNAVPLTTGALKRIDNSFYAGNFGVVGNGIVDDTAAAQAFLDLCKPLQRTAYFGALRVKITGPLVAENTGIVFDQFAYGEGSPGFYPTGSGYTALTVLGAVADFCVSVIGTGGVSVDGKVVGSGEAVIGGPGTVTADTRPQVNGIRFGAIGRGPALASVIRSARAYKLGGFGISGLIWDATLLALSVEQCGKGDTHAYSLQGGSSDTTNECNFVRIQVELSVGRCLYIAPQTLSCSFGKIHAERTYGRPDDIICQFGPGNYQPVRLSTINGNGRAKVLAQSGSFTGYRPEGMTTEIDSSGGAVEFNSTEGGVYFPSPGSSGAVNFFGGMASFRAAVTNWRAVGVSMPTADIGEVADGYFVELAQCRINSLTRSNGFAAIRLTDGRVEGLSGGQWRHISVGGSARVMLAGGAQTFGNMKLTVESSGIIVGNVTADNVGMRLNGQIVGNYTITGQNQTLFGPTAVVTGTITGNGPPTSADFLDDRNLGMFYEGMYSKNMRPAVTGAAGAQVAVTHWQYIGGAWRAMTSGVAA